MTERVPDYCEPLIGWRCWRLQPFAADGWVVDPDADQFRAPSGQSLWSGPENAVCWPTDAAMQAVCLCPEKTCRDAKRYAFVDVANMFRPRGACAECPSAQDIDGVWYYPCGIYAWRDRQLQYDAWAATRGVSNGLVLGTVRLWGIVRPHERGYRAQYAYPDAITFAGAGHGTAEAVASAYRVPYRPDKEFEDEYRRAEADHLRRTAAIAGPVGGAAAYYYRFPFYATSFAPRSAESGRAAGQRLTGSTVKIVQPSWLKP